MRTSNAPSTVPMRPTANLGKFCASPLHHNFGFEVYLGIISDAASGVDNPLSDGDLPPAIGFGSLAQVLEPNSAKTSDKHVTHANNSILLWCGAKLTLNDSDFLEIDKVRWSRFPNSSASLAEATVVIESVPSEVCWTLYLLCKNLHWIDYWRRLPTTPRHSILVMLPWRLRGSTDAICGTRARFWRPGTCLSTVSLLEQW